MKLVGFLVIGALFLLAFVDVYQEHVQLEAVKSFTGYKDAHPVWTVSSSEGGFRNFTYWNDDKCQAIIKVQGDNISYVTEPHCSTVKLTKD